MRKAAITVLIVALVGGAAAAFMLTRPGGDAETGPKPVPTSATPTTTVAPEALNPAELIVEFPEIPVLQEWFLEELSRGLTQQGGDQLIGMNPPQITWASGVAGGASRSYKGRNTRDNSNMRLEITVLLAVDEESAWAFGENIDEVRGREVARSTDDEVADLKRDARYIVPGDEYLSASETIMVKGRLIVWVQAFDTDRGVNYLGSTGLVAAMFLMALAESHPTLV